MKKEKQLQLVCYRIRKFRLEKQLSQQNVADQLKMSQNAYYKIENGKTRLLVSTLISLKEIFGVRMSDFFRGID